jgi:DNA-binding transcriptional LysR family regulator
MSEDIFAKSGFSLDRCLAFIAAAEAGGITQAASGSASRQSQLSRQIGELEAWLGAKLLVRGRGRFALTEVGKELLNLSNGYFSGLARIKAGCANGITTIRIGAGESLLQWVAVPGMARVQTQARAYRWHLQNLRSEEIFSQLLDGSLDMGLIRGKRAPKQLKTEKIGNLTYALYVPKALAITKGRYATKPKPLALLEGSNHLENVNPTGKTGDAEWEVAIQCTSLAQAAEAVRQGIAGAVLPRCIQSLMPVDVVLKPLKGSEANPPLYIVWNAQTARQWPALIEAKDQMVKALAEVCTKRES